MTLHGKNLFSHVTNGLLLICRIFAESLQILCRFLEGSPLDCDSLAQSKSLCFHLSGVFTTLDTSDLSSTSCAGDISISLVVADNHNLVAMCRLIILTVSTFLAALEEFLSDSFTVCKIMISPCRAYALPCMFTVCPYRYRYLRSPYRGSVRTDVLDLYSTIYL